MGFTHWFLTLLCPSSRFKPTDIPNCDLWLAADHITGLSDGDPITTWPDLSGNGNDFTQAGVKRPSYETNQINRYPAAGFDGADGIMLAANFSAATEGALFVVWRPSAPIANVQCLFSSSEEAADVRYWAIRGYLLGGEPNINVIQRDSDAEDSYKGATTVVAGTVYLVVWQSSGTAWTARLNCATEALVMRSGANNGDWLGDTADRDNFALGARKGTGESNFTKGHIAEVILYGRGLSMGEILRIENYLRKKYGFI